MSDITEHENGRIYTNRTPPCGHANGTHPSGCWYVAVVEARAPLEAEITRLREALARALGAVRAASDRDAEYGNFDGRWDDEITRIEQLLGRHSWPPSVHPDGSAFCPDDGEMWPCERAALAQPEDDHE